MRADRLLALLMILQLKGRQTAARLAAELEVTERTIYRDVLALSTAGVPVYCERGPGGGIGLLEDYHTNLTGLTASEARALFMLSIPAPLVDLGVTQDLQSALRKLAAALPATRLPEAILSLERVYLDWTTWERSPDPAPHLGAIQQAVWKGNCLGITYRSPLFGDWIEPLQAMIEPYGLVAKAGHWYLVCTANGHFQVIPVDNIHCIDQVGASFTRSTGFDLAVFWREWCASQRKNQPQYLVRLRVASAAMPILKRRFAHMDVIKQLEGENPEGRQEFNVLFESLEEARSYLLGYGQAVEVLEPEALRLSLADFARQIVNLYLCYNFPHSRSTC